MKRNLRVYLYVCARTGRTNSTMNASTPEGVDEEVDREDGGESGGESSKERQSGLIATDRAAP